MFTHPGLTFRMLQSLDEFYVRNITARNFVIIWQYSDIASSGTLPKPSIQAINRKKQKAPAGALIS